jgi:hypothetical protein
VIGRPVLKIEDPAHAFLIGDNVEKKAAFNASNSIERTSYFFKSDATSANRPRAA